MILIIYILLTISTFARIYHKSNDIYFCNNKIIFTIFYSVLFTKEHATFDPDGHMSVTGAFSQNKVVLQFITQYAESNQTCDCSTASKFAESLLNRERHMTSIINWYSFFFFQFMSGTNYSIQRFTRFRIQIC